MDYKQFVLECDKYDYQMMKGKQRKQIKQHNKKVQKRKNEKLEILIELITLLIIGMLVVACGYITVMTLGKVILNCYEGYFVPISKFETIVSLISFTAFEILLVSVKGK